MSDAPEVTDERICERLKELALSIGDHANGKGRGWSEFYMSIPADPRRDADLIMTAAARRIQEKNAQIAELEAQLAQCPRAIEQ